MNKYHPSYRVNEILMASLCFLWAFWIVVFGTYQTSNSLAPMREMGVPGWVPIICMTSVGIGLLFGPKRWRKHIHLFMTGFWMFICASLVSVNPALTGVPTYAILSLLHASKYIYAERGG